uniref:Uncharacterized protein n=1 Tax=viral metagenome TaxID=1070528 RepID=A0A6H1ZAQ5_9ZZZZ
MKTTVTNDLLRTILNHYPIVPSHLIHSAGRSFCLSGDRRLRELSKKGVIYTYKKHQYDFTETPPLILRSLIQKEE